MGESETDHVQPTQGQEPGGRSSRGPAIDAGGESEPQGLVPPYEGRSTGEDSVTGLDAESSAAKAYDAEGNAPEPGPGREISDEERSGVESTDMDATSALGHGVSTTESAEDLAARSETRGRGEEGTKGESGRPYGKATPEHSTGVGAQENRDKESPDMPAGDQGG